MMYTRPSLTFKVKRLYSSKKNKITSPMIIVTIYIIITYIENITERKPYFTMQPVFSSRRD